MFPHYVPYKGLHCRIEETQTKQVMDMANGAYVNKSEFIHFGSKSSKPRCLILIVRV